MFFTTQIIDGIARVGFDLPGEPVNKITRSVREEMEQELDALKADSQVKAAVIISDKPGSFIAGADIDEFVALETRDEAFALVRAGQALVNKLADLGKPVVAAIHGACLGGGFEAALACSYRVATSDPKTKIGLPEVQLGIIPAAGGCQRLPRLVGLRAALDMILAGRQVPAAVARRRGMVDELVHPAILEEVALQAARQLADGWKPGRRKKSLSGVAFDGNPAGRRLVYRGARRQVLKRTGGNYPAPLAALDAVQRGLEHGIEAGLGREAEHFADLAVSDVSRKLVRIFFATTALKKDPGVPPPVPSAKPVHSLGIVGAGFMGAGIGGVAVAQAGLDVRFRDMAISGVAKGLATARKILQERHRRRRITRHELLRLEQLLSGGTGWDGFGRVDVVIEAVFEDLDVKHQVFRELEQHVRDDCILASNTSTIPIQRIATVVAKPERVLGMHFFSPVDRMPLLEVIVTDRTAPQATVTAVELGRSMGKTVIVVQDHPGFWVNRILAPYLNEAGRLLEEGVTVETIDRAMQRFGFPVGPITLLDEVGLDVAEKASKVLHEAFGDRLKPMEGLSRLTAEGRLGRKSGRGFYRYEQGKKRGVDETAYEIIEAEVGSKVPREDVTRRLVYAMLNEAARALDEGAVRSARDGDIGAIFGIGFPPFRGGPLAYLDDLSATNAVQTLNALKAQYGERFAPAPRLERMAERGDRFYPSD